MLIRTLSTVLFLFVVIFSQASIAASTPEFWQLTKGKQTLWILGSVHVANESFYPLPDAVLEAFEQAETLYVEVDLSKASKAEQASAMQLAMLPAGQQLKYQLTAKTYRLFQTQIAAMALPEVMFQSYKPWFAAIMLMQAKIQTLGFKAEQGIDHYFLQLALKADKDIRQFESFQQQMAMLAKTEAHQELMLSATIEQIPQLEREVAKIMRAWKSGNAEDLQQILLEQSGPQEVQDWINNILLKERNINWQSILRKQQPKSAFIVVGALHVGGEHGLLELLKKDGFTLKRIK